MNRCLVRILAIGVVSFAASAFAAKSPEQKIAEATNRIAIELEKGPRLELPPLSGADAAVEAPEPIRSAGEEFVSVWKLSRRLHLAAAPPPQALDADKPQQATEIKDFNLDRFVQRAIEENPPPALEEYWAVFDLILPTPNQDCGQDVADFVIFCDSLLGLRSLRTGKYLEAYGKLGVQFTKARESILRAYGIDPEDILIGSWLHGNPYFDNLRHKGKEKSASMLLKWAEMRWKQVGKEALKDDKLKLPAFPADALISFLRPANGVKDETKAKISQFLATNGVQIHPASYWLNAMPEGAEAWMIPIAKMGLNDELNKTREKASAVLTKAGVPHDPPAMMLPARLRVTMDGKPLPKDLAETKDRKSHLTVTLTLTERSSRSFDVWMKEDGVFELNPDELAGLKITAATLTFPRNHLSPTSSPAEPLLETSLPLPLRPGETRDIDFPSVEVTIRPALPADRVSPARLIEIEFGPVAGQASPRGYLYHLEGSDELVLPHVSPGEYWLRVRHPGATRMDWSKVKVGPTERLLAPRLEAGSNLVVPLTPAKLEIPESWSPELVQGLGIHQGNAEVIIELWQKGKQVTDWNPAPEGAKDQFPNSAIFANLPPGEYEVRTWRRATSTPSRQLIEPRSISVSIRPDSPVYLLTEPLELKLNPLESKTGN